MKIFFVINKIDNSGPARGMFAIINGLKKNEVRKSNIDIQILALRRNDKKYSFADYTNVMYAPDYRYIKNIRVFIFYLKSLLKYQPDFVLSTGLRSDLLNIIKLGSNQRITIVRASSYKESIEHNFRNYSFKYFFILLNYLIAGFKDIVIYFTEEMIDNDRPNYIKRPGAFYHIGNFIDESSKGNRMNLVNRDWHKKETWTLITVGHLSERKNVGDIIYSVAELRKRGADVRLKIVGDGPLKQDLLDLASALNINNYVTFIGEVPDVEPYYKIADIFVMASKHEGQPRSALEALYHNLPIVMPNISGSRDLVNNTNGLVYEQGKLSEAILKLIKEFENYTDAKISIQNTQSECCMKLKYILEDSK